MARRIVPTDPTTRRVALKASTSRRSAVDVGRALGAEQIASDPRAGSPLGFAAVREEIFHRLRSSGGRPGFEGADRKKIPLTPKDWEIAEQVAIQIAEPGFRPSAGQVAGVLLSLALNSMNEAMESKLKRRLKASA
jgi:hypothetical protein